MFETFPLRLRSTRQPLTRVISRPRRFHFSNNQSFFNGDVRPIIIQLLGEGSGLLGGPYV